MAASILSSFPLPPTYLPSSPRTIRHANPPPTLPPSGPLPPLPPYPSPITERDSLLFLTQPKRNSRRLSSTGSAIGNVNSRPMSDHEPLRFSRQVVEHGDTVLHGSLPARPLKSSKSLGSGLLSSSRKSSGSDKGRRRVDDDRASSPDIPSILKATPRPRMRRGSAPGRPLRRKSTMSNGSLGAPCPPSSRDNGSQESFRSSSPLLPDHTSLSSPPTSDSEHSESSIDIHTPLPHLMVRAGLLSPHSKILVNAILPTTDSNSGDKPTKVRKDTRDTEERRTRHRDGKLLRDGIGLTTGLGWSDSEDEGAPSALTRRLSSLDLSSRRISNASLHSTRSFSSISHARQYQERSKLLANISVPPSAFPKTFAAGSDPSHSRRSSSFFSPLSPDFPPTPISHGVTSGSPELSKKGKLLPPVLTSIPPLTTNVIAPTPSIPPPLHRIDTSLSSKPTSSIQPLTHFPVLASTHPPISPTSTDNPQRTISSKYVTPPPRLRSLPVPVMLPSSTVPTPHVSEVPVLPATRPPSSFARLSTASNSSIGSERKRTVSTTSSSGSVPIPSPTNNPSLNKTRQRALSGASSTVSSSSSRGPAPPGGGVRRPRTLSSTSSNGATTSKMPVPALPTTPIPNSAKIARLPSTGTGMTYRTVRTGTTPLLAGRSSLGSNMKPTGVATPTPSRLSAPSTYNMVRRPSIINMGTAATSKGVSTVSITESRWTAL